MKKAIKWTAIIGGGFIVLVIAALLIIPMFVDIQKYKPEIEKKVAEATGRPFNLGGDLSLSLFPWAGISLSDLHLGNPSGFTEKEFVTVESFEVRVKLLPLISKDIQVKRFILKGPRIVLERLKDGRGNWEGIGNPSQKPVPAPTKEVKGPSKKKPGMGLPIKSLAVGEFAITEGNVLWIDQAKGERKEVSDITLRLKDVSFDRPIHLALSANLDGKPLSLEGTVGPLGKEPGKGTIPLDIVIKVLKQLNISLKGKLTDPADKLRFDLALKVSPFSPRKLMEALGQPFPVKTTDPKALNSMALKLNLKGDPQNISASDGVLDLDDSKLTFSVRAKEFSKPDVKFDLNLDKIDVDRYLPPPSEKKPEQAEKKAAAPAPEKKKTDYTPLRKLVLEGTIRSGEIKAHGAKIRDLNMRITGKKGLFHLDPLALKLYEGDMSFRGTLDVRRDTPRTDMKLRIKQVQVGPLLKDLMKKDFIEGTVKADMDIRMAGDDADGIKRTLNGKGDLLFNDGAIVGIDLAGMIRNVKATFGLAEKGAEKPRTDFSELHAPFTIKNGLVHTPKTSMKSPLLRVLVAGDAHLVKESLDFRVEPKVVTTIKGQGDTKQRSGIMVPVLISGTFSEPKFRPDLKGMLKKGIEEGISDPSKLKDMFKSGSKEKGEPKESKGEVKGLLKGLLGK
ncbi:MAG: AsmA family protein [Deltaproteobacteria bacterium]|nr:AsmA family protein [Deltaproteobacteria bacterium]